MWTRRRLLFQAGQGSTAALLCGMDRPLAAANRAVTVAGHPWVYAAPRPQYDLYGVLDEVFADMSAAGVGAVELMHTALLPDNAVPHIRELSKRHRLPVIGSSYSAPMWQSDERDNILKQARMIVMRLAKVGGRTFGVSVGQAPARKNEAQFDAQAVVLRRLMSMCRDEGIVMNLHNHTYEVADGEHDLRGTLQRLPDAKLGPDFNWLLRGGVNPVDFIKRHGRRIVYGHLRDQNAAGKWTEAMGEGAMDYSAIGAALREANFQGDLAIELAHERGFTRTRTLRESLRLSRDYVKRVMGW